MFIPPRAALSARGSPSGRRSPSPRSPTKPEPAASHINGTETIADAGPYAFTSPLTATLIGYARCSTDRQDLVAQRQALLELGVAEDRIDTDHGLTGTTRARPGLDQALAAVREGEPLVGPKVDRLARSVPEPAPSPGSFGNAA